MRLETSYINNRSCGPTILYRDSDKAQGEVDCTPAPNDRKSDKAQGIKSDKAQGIKSDKAHGQWANAHGQLSNGSDVA